MRRFSLGLHPTDGSHRVTTLELLFDLVFVYALTQITTTMAHDLTLTGLAHGLVLMMLIWFGWTAYGWLGNQARADEGALRTAMIFAMVGYFLVALAVPEAFHDRPGGLSGPLVFVLAYAVVRLAHLGVYWLAAGDDTGLIRTLQRAFYSVLPALVLLTIGALVDERWRLAVWASAMALEYVLIFLIGSTGWRIHAPAHFAERHGLIVIIAIGESIVSIGVGVAGAPISWQILVGATLGMAIAVTLWWTYFDVVALVAERTLERLTGDDRVRLGRDSYTFLHLPIVTGVVLLAVGAKVVLLQAAEPAQHHASLPGVAIWAIYGGAALYLVSLSMLRWRNIGRPNIERLVVACLLLVLAALVSFTDLPALWHPALIALTMISLVGYEAYHFRDVRQQVRHADHAHHSAEGGHRR
jgi:low temperature requirement protein LtrA